jgi:GT2 family glycosyltransferase
VDPRTTVVCPTVVSGEDKLLPLNRLVRARRFVRSPLVPARYDADEEPIDTASFVGPLIRADAARRAGLPERRVFIRFDDIEYIDRLGAEGAVVNVSAARIRHKEPVPLTDVSLLGTLRAFLTQREFAGQWKHLYGVRNLIWAGRRHGWMTRANALGMGLQNVLLFLALGERRLRLAHLAALYVSDGLRGVFRNVAPGDWAGLAEASSARAYLREHGLRYDAETDAAPRSPAGSRQEQR